MATTRAYNVYVGTETGLLKGINAADRSWQNLNSISDASRSKEVTCLCWGSDKQSEICAGLRNNTVLCMDASGTVTKEIEMCGSQGQLSTPSGHVKGLARYDRRFVTGFSNGVFSVWGEDDLEEEVVNVETGDNLWTLAQNWHERNLIATGGKENHLKLWDLNDTTKPIFTAKNVRNDWLNLRVPVWVTRAVFLGEGRRLVAGTGHHQVYVYDPNAPQRRPVLEMKFLEQPVTAVAVRPGADHQVMVGNTLGDMGLLDLRRGQVVQLYKGFSGGITDIQCHPTNPVAVSCSIDRFVRVHNIHDKTMAMKFYLKSRLNCLLLTDDWPEDDADLDPARETTQKRAVGDDSRDEDAGKDDDDAVWDTLDVVKTKVVQSKGQKRKSVPQNESPVNDASSKKKKKKKAKKT